MSKFGDGLRDALKMRAMSQKQLGKNVGASEFTISKYVNGLSMPRKSRIASIEQSLALERGSLQRLADEDAGEAEDEETRQDKILKAWQRGKYSPSQVAERTGYPIHIVGKYLPLGLEREQRK